MQAFRNVLVASPLVDIVLLRYRVYLPHLVALVTLLFSVPRSPRKAPLRSQETLHKVPVPVRKPRTRV